MRLFLFAILLSGCGGAVASSDTGTDVMCAPSKSAGETCALGAGGLLPTDVHECEHGLYCRFTEVSSKSGVCSVFAPLGAPCESLFTDCASGAMCKTDSLGHNGVCVDGGPLRQDHGEGAPCSDDPMSVIDCASGLRCMNSLCRRC